MPPPIIAAGKGRKTGSALQFYGNIFGLHIVPEGLATFLAAIAGFTKPTERCLDAAGIPFVDEHLPSAQLPRGAGCTIEVAREDAANEPIRGSIGNLNGFTIRREFQNRNDRPLPGLSQRQTR